MTNLPKREYVEAPAGHGKTEAIALEVSNYTGKNRILILTHTNAGVNTLRKRLKLKHVQSCKYDLLTIDAFCLKYSRYYPTTSGIPKNIQDYSSINYKQAQIGAIKVFSKSDLKIFLKTRYALLIVDEYQDCSKTQHELVLKLSEEIDCLAFGDPMQGIFDFNSDGFSWDLDLCTNFQINEVINLNIPYRWTNSGNEELGFWISDAREKLKGNKAYEIDFDALPTHISVHTLATETERIIPDIATKISGNIPDKGSVLALIPNLPERSDLHHAIAGKMYRTLQSIDRMDAKKVISYLQKLDIFLNSFRRSPVSLYSLIRDDLAKACMTGSPALPNSIKSKLSLYPTSSIDELRLKGNRMGEDNKMVYFLLLDIYEDKSPQTAIRKILKLMDFIESKSIKKYRRELWYSAKEALRKHLTNDSISLEESGYLIRQKISFVGRNFKRVIGNTLLTKGLEFDHVIIVDPTSFTNKNLYVSISRACKSIVVIKTTPTLREYVSSLRSNL